MLTLVNSKIYRHLANAKTTSIAPIADTIIMSCLQQIYAYLLVNAEPAEGTSGKFWTKYPFISGQYIKLFQVRQKISLPSIFDTSLSSFMISLPKAMSP